MTVQPQSRAVRVGYFVRIPNVGDLVNPSVVTALSGHPTFHVGNSSEPHLLAVGSIMARAGPASHVWGTGVMHPDIGVGVPRLDNIHALRGRLSHAALRQKDIAVGDVPLGDPGYLAPGLLGIDKSTTPKFRIGLVCHYVDRHHPVLKQMMKEPGVADLNVHDQPESLLRRMAECETVISTSLHGLIFAEALGIPNLWVKAGNDIAGDDFKFRDWFSTTRRPQPTPHILTANDTAESLAIWAEPRESAIDADALKASFPHKYLEEMQLPAARRVIAVPVCRGAPTPVILISFNRGEMLKRSIASIRSLARPTEIIIHDNGSSDAETLRTLEELEKNGIRVFKYPAIASADELNGVNDTVQSYFAEWGEPRPYVVSDCDVDMSIAQPHALDVYEALLRKHRGVECGGPMLRISDIPHTYPLFNRVMNRHIEEFWRQDPIFDETTFGPVAFLQALIDTTFALHRAGEPFRRLKAALRVYEPFEARHLDWYLSANDNDTYANTSHADISHWNNTIERARYKDAQLEYSEFTAVRISDSGTLEVYKERLSM